jgi:hypothetical protein
VWGVHGRVLLSSDSVAVAIAVSVLIELLGLDNPLPRGKLVVLVRRFQLSLEL